MVENSLTVRLELESLPENVTLVRSAVTGIAEALDLGPELTSDLKTALSEACNNVALHAYGDETGPMLVRIDGSAAGVHAAVVDFGSGILRISGDEDRMGLGLAVISALASATEFIHPETGGTEVRMFFRHPLARGSVLPEGSALDDELPWLDETCPGQIRAYIAPVSATRYVLGRMVQALAATSHFSVTKLSDLRAANDAIAHYIETAGNGAINIAISAGARRLSMTATPLPANDPENARAVLAPVVDDLRAERDALSVELRDHSRDAV